jgi:hypothetical protein
MRGCRVVITGVQQCFGVAGWMRVIASLPLSPVLGLPQDEHQQNLMATLTPHPSLDALLATVRQNGRCN